MRSSVARTSDGRGVDLLQQRVVRHRHIEATCVVQLRDQEQIRQCQVIADGEAACSARGEGLVSREPLLDPHPAPAGALLQVIGVGLACQQSQQHMGERGGAAYQHIGSAEAVCPH